MATEPPRLDDTLARQVLIENRLIDASRDVSFQELGGGVSSVVLLAAAPDRSFVLKQPQPRFAVRDEWLVDTDRIASEVEFVRLVGQRLGPGAVMPVLAFDEERRVAVFAAAPPNWTSWKQRLLKGQVDVRLAAAAGDWLGRAHALGELRELRGRMDHPRLFDQQRLDPYYRTTAARLPEAREALLGLIEDFGRRADLVHGDFSPKNILTDGSAITVIDHEVVTRGDAAFDTAFLLNHLILKAVHLPARREELLAAARAARDAYDDRRGGDDDLWRRTMAHLAGLQLARAHGKSPAEYLTSDERKVVTRFGLDLVRRPAADLDQALDRLPEALTGRDL